MKTIPTLALLACLGFTGCYTQLYTQGYGERTLDDREYANANDTQADTGLTYDSSGTARREGDTLYRPATVVVNNYYHESPYYRGYRVDDWEYPFISFGFYSSGYRDYNGAYWWNGNGYHRGNYRSGRDYRGSYPSSGGGTPGPYQSDKRLFSPPPDHPRKGRRAPSGNGGSAAPAPKTSSGGGASAPVPSPAPAASGNDSKASSGDTDKDKGKDDQDDHPAVNKGRRR